MKTRIALISLAAAGIVFGQTPAFDGTSVVNASSFQTPVAPGSLVSIFGTNLATSMASSATIPLSNTLGGVTVQFVQGTNTYTAPLQFTFPGNSSAASQLNIQVPWELVPGGPAVSAIVTLNGNSSNPEPVAIGPQGPGVFSSNGLAIATNNSDGTLVWAAGTVPGTTTHAATAGDVVIIYATGLGAVDTPIPDGQAPAFLDNTLRNTIATPTVLVGGVQAQLVYSVLSPQFVGIDQLAIIIPTGVKPGSSVPLQIQAGGITSPTSAAIAVQ
jgi:uncharacterized protein (TIGR03437 family)